MNGSGASAQPHSHPTPRSAHGSARPLSSPLPLLVSASARFGACCGTRHLSRLSLMTQMVAGRYDTRPLRSLATSTQSSALVMIELGPACKRVQALGPSGSRGVALHCSCT